MKRVVIALALATGVVACLGNTTSLGGPEGNQASASTTPDGAPEAENPPADNDAGDAADAADADDCYWYAFAPSPATEACTYSLPTRMHWPDYQPEWDSRDPLWNPAKAFVVTGFWHPEIGPDDRTRTNYVNSLASCPPEGGWYYDETSVDAEGLHTRYVLCPGSCDRVNDGAWFGFWVTTCTF